MTMHLKDILMSCDTLHMTILGGHYEMLGVCFVCFLTVFIWFRVIISCLYCYLW